MVKLQLPGICYHMLKSYWPFRIDLTDGGGLILFMAKPVSGIVLFPAASCVRVYNGFYKAPQDSNCFGTGNGIFRGKQVVSLTVHHACLLHGLYRAFHTAADLVVICKYLCFAG